MLPHNSLVAGTIIKDIREISGLNRQTISRWVILAALSFHTYAVTGTRLRFTPFASRAP